MATQQFGTPAPRRTNRPAARQPTGFTPPPPAKRPRGGSRQISLSRFRAPARATGHGSGSIRDDRSVASSMDVDEGGIAIFERSLRQETVFAKSDELLVVLHSHLPTEVKQVLKVADFFRDSYSGDIDMDTGFAVVATSQTCFVWQHTQAVSVVPTCYIFSCPEDASFSAPFHAFVPYGLSREPGLILLSSSGEIRFWDSIGIGLAGGEHYFKSQLGIESGEYATTLARADSQTFIASTSYGRLFRLTLTSTGGKYHLTSRLFARAQSSLSLTRFLPNIFSTQSLLTKEGNAFAVAMGAKTPAGRDVWALVDTRLQKWTMATDGWEELTLDVELLTVVRPALQDSLFGPGSSASGEIFLDVEFLSMAVEESGKVVVLVSHGGLEDDTDMEIGATPRRIYLLVRLSVLSAEIMIDSMINVPYQTTFGATQAPMHPQLRLMLGGTIAVVQFGDAVTLCAKDTGYQDRVELKSAADRTLGVGVLESQSELLILTATTMMKVTLDYDRVENFHPETGRSNLIQSIMTQAILYGSNAGNPLSFSFPPEIDEDSLMAGAEQLSRSILESDNLVVRPNNDLNAQMTNRKARLAFLINFINENGVLGKISQRSRQRLATDAERLYAGQQLWLRLSAMYAPGTVHNVHVFFTAVRQYMESVGEGHHEDQQRAFFRLRVGELGKVLPICWAYAKSRMDEGPAVKLEALTETNDIFLTVLMAAIEWRDWNRLVYGVELPYIKPWTSGVEIIQVVMELFEDAAAFLESREQGETLQEQRVGMLRGQLAQLAEVVFHCFNERLAWVQSAAAAGEPGTDRDKALVEERFTHLRPKVLDALRRNGFTNEAFRLAEQYHDYRSLAALCTKEQVYPPEMNPNGAMIEMYVEKFQDAFTDELFQWYIEHGELRALFAQESLYSDHMDRFFARFSHPSIAWLHALKRGKWDDAAETLLGVSDGAGELATKEVVLSVGKLAGLVYVREGGGRGGGEGVAKAFHDRLNFVSVHRSLADELKSALPGRGKQSLESQVEAITRAKATKLAQYSALPLVFKQLVRALLQGKALSVEDTADLMSLKDNADSVADYRTCLDLIAADAQIPETRRQTAFKAIWRRIYDHDDWWAIKQTSGLSDDAVNARYRQTALFHVLRNTIAQRRQNAGYALTPHEILEGVPSAEEIGQRWTGMSPEQVEALARDYGEECERLRRWELQKEYERVSELVELDFR